MWTNVCPSFLKFFEIGLYHLQLKRSWLRYFLITDKMKDSELLSLIFSSSVHFSILCHFFLAQKMNATPWFKAHSLPFCPPPVSPTALFLLFFTLSLKCTNFQLFSNMFHLYVSFFTKTFQRVSLHHFLYFHFHSLLCILFSYSSHFRSLVVSYWQVR